MLAQLTLVASSVYQHWLCIRLAAAVKVAAAKTTQWLEHAATRGVATAFSSWVVANSLQQQHYLRQHASKHHTELL
jgi:hypothetical protein